MPYKDPEVQRAHNKIYQRKHYQKRKQYYKDKQTEYRKKSRSYVWNLKEEGCCKICGEEHPATLEFHHINPKEKEYSIAILIARHWSIKRIQTEIDKCLLLCSNCHRKLHYEEKLRDS